jgi:hypothetical protein
MARDTNGSHGERVWNLAKQSGFAMLATRDGERLRARPIGAYVARDDTTIYFLTDPRRTRPDRGDNRKATI